MSNTQNILLKIMSDFDYDWQLYDQNESTHVNYIDNDIVFDSNHETSSPMVGLSSLSTDVNLGTYNNSVHQEQTINWVGAGVLPFARSHTNDIYFLLGKECESDEWKCSSNKWCDFSGGRNDDDVSPAHTASREFCEELCGVDLMWSNAFYADMTHRLTDEQYSIRLARTRDSQSATSLSTADSVLDLGQIITNTNQLTKWNITYVVEIPFYPELPIIFDKHKSQLLLINSERKRWCRRKSELSEWIVGHLRECDNHSKQIEIEIELVERFCHANEPCPFINIFDPGATLHSESKNIITWLTQRNMCKWQMNQQIPNVCKCNEHINLKLSNNIPKSDLNDSCDSLLFANINSLQLISANYIKEYVSEEIHEYVKFLYLTNDICKNSKRNDNCTNCNNDCTNCNYNCTDSNHTDNNYANNEFYDHKENNNNCFLEVTLYPGHCMYATCVSITKYWLTFLNIVKTVISELPHLFRALDIIRINTEIVDAKVHDCYLEKQTIDWWSIPNIVEALRNGGSIRNESFRTTFAPILSVLMDILLYSNFDLLKQRNDFVNIVAAPFFFNERMSTHNRECNCNCYLYGNLHNLHNHSTPYNVNHLHLNTCKYWQTTNREQLNCYYLVDIRPWSMSAAYFNCCKDFNNNN